MLKFKTHKNNLKFRNYCSNKPVALNSIIDLFNDQSNDKKNMIFLHGLFGSGSNWRAISNSVKKLV